jgi:hypothetical protein
VCTQLQEKKQKGMKKWKKCGRRKEKMEKRVNKCLSGDLFLQPGSSKEEDTL